MGDDPADGKPFVNTQQAFAQALAEFSEALDRLYVEHGAPPLRELASRGKLLSPSNVSEILSGRRLPSIDVTIDLVRALMAQRPNHETEQRVQEWRVRWQGVKLLQRRVSRTPMPIKQIPERPSSAAVDIASNTENSAEIGSMNLIAEARAEAARILGEASNEAEQIIAAAHAKADKIRFGESGGNRDRLLGQLIEVLAKIFPDDRSSELLLHQIGYPASHFPAWGNPLEGWITVIRELEAGIMKDGITRLITNALRIYMYNADLRRIADELENER